MSKEILKIKLTSRRGEPHIEEKARGVDDSDDDDDVILPKINLGISRFS